MFFGPLDSTGAMGGVVTQNLKTNYILFSKNSIKVRFLANILILRGDSFFFKVNKKKLNKWRPF